MPLATRLARAALDAGGGFDAAELLATIMMFGDQPHEALAVLDAVDEQATSDDAAGPLADRPRPGQRTGGSAASRRADELAVEPRRSPTRPTRPGCARSRRSCGCTGWTRPTALRIARLDPRPAGRPGRRARALAQCTIAHLQAAQGELRGASERAIASVQADAPLWRTDMPYLQLALELARGTRLALAGDLAGIDAIVADEFADLADAGDFRLGSGYLAILRAQAARLRGQTGEALRTSVQACAVLATSRIYAGLAHAERAQAHALRGEADEARAAMADSDDAQRARSGDPLPVAGAGPGRRLAAGAGDVPARDRDARSAGLAAARPTASPATRCSRCTTWSGWARRPMSVDWPDGTLAGPDRRAAARRAGRAWSTATLPGIMVPRTPGPPPAGSGPDLLLAADAFAALRPLRVRRRGRRRPRSGGCARSRAAARLGQPPGWASCWSRCDMLRTPALRRCAARR